MLFFSCCACYLDWVLIWNFIVTQHASMDPQLYHNCFRKVKMFFFVLSAAKSPTVSHVWIKSNQKREFNLWVCSYSMRRNETMNFKRLHVASGRSSLCRGWAAAHFTWTPMEMSHVQMALCSSSSYFSETTKQSILSLRSIKNKPLLVTFAVQCSCCIKKLVNVKTVQEFCQYWLCLMRIFL